VLLVAWFEIHRAIRTWRALALIALYSVASGGAAWLFVRVVGMMENSLARQLSVAPTRTPGAMLSELVRSPMWRDVLEAMTGSPHLVEALVQVPPLALFDLWFGFLIVPFFAASASAECIAIDTASRAIRYEAQRTGRLELVLGRFAGQLVLTALASLASLGVVYATGLLLMVGNEPLSLLGWLAWYAPRTLTYGVPFVAVGVAASQLTSSPAWARVMAVSAVAASWVALGLARYAEIRPGWGVLADVALQLLPQGWLRGLWEPGLGWLGSAVACCAIGAATLCAGYLRFSQRDL
jgi:ABC-type transport system involved in multi-copper enzyme maturation permease subunit